MMKGITPAHLSQYLKSTKSYERVLKNLKIITLENGNCVAELKVDEEHTNPLGGLHGGLSATLVDSVSSFAFQTHPKATTASVSVDIHMSYLKAAKMGEEILIDAKTLRAGKTLAFLEVEIKNKQTGDLLVKGSHTKFLLGGK